MKTTKVTFKPTGVEAESTTYEFGDHISELTVTVTPGTAVTAVSGASYPGSSSYGANLSLYQDLDQKGFLRFLWNNAGKKFTMTVSFVDDADTFEGIVTLVPAGFGGAAGNDLPTSSITLAYDGKPEWKSASS
ncbi:MAG: hypothetical protein PT944_06470 [Actinomycetaceae bacterium]|nr:hypothetical protein [Actinomycetaceae bacterium]MDY5273013.1 hypothetical protein [Arcanobacterium sp.]